MADDTKLEEGEYIVENKWFCSSCKSENRGRDMKCQKCGAPKEKDEEYVLPSEGERTKVEDPEQLKQAEAGPHWVCEFCCKEQRNLFSRCKYCGAEREKEKKSAISAPLPGRPEPPTRGFPWAKALLGGGGAALLIGLLVWAVIPHEKRVKVESMTWRTTAQLREKTLRHGTGWSTDEPAGAFNAVCERKFKENVQCHPHDCRPHPVEYQCRPHQCNPRQTTYRCSPHNCNCHEECRNLKNGYSACKKVCETCYDSCTRTEYETCHDTCYRTEYETCHDTCTRTEYDTCYDSCPVYEDWCSYDYYDWPVVKHGAESGSGPDVRWPALVSEADAAHRVEQSGEYVVRFTDGKKIWDYHAKDVADYQRFRVGTKWIVNDGLGGVEPLHPADVPK